MPFSKRILLAALPVLLLSCSVSKQIGRAAKADILDNKALETAHIGISLYDPAAGKYLYNYQGDKYFVPASNTKIPTCYAAMKYLGDSLVGLRYGFSEKKDTSSFVILGLQATADPTFFHKEFTKQPVLNFFQSNLSRFKYNSAWLDTAWKEQRWGSGWSWSDYEEPYMAERSQLPLFGNTISIRLRPLPERVALEKIGPLYMFETQIPYFDSLIHREASIYPNEVLWHNEKPFDSLLFVRIKREIQGNSFSLAPSPVPFSTTEISFVSEPSVTNRLLQDTVKYIFCRLSPRSKTEFSLTYPDSRIRRVTIRNWQTIHSQPTDSLLKPMMHRSDNFFAEQSLLMVSNEHIGYMNDAAIIDTLLKTDFRDLPQKPRWVDGSGLSRYNLFTPQDLVTILHKMQKEFGMDRVKNILPTGGEGTISNYYKADSSYIFVKTGTLSGVVALSGFLYTQKGKEIIFSILVNNHQASATEVRRAVEKFIQGIRKRY